MHVQTKSAPFFQTWVKITDGVSQDPTCSDAFGHIVQTLSQLEDKDTLWKFADWTLQRNQEVLFKKISLSCLQRAEFHSLSEL